MGSRARWLLCVLAVLAAVLTAATYAYAVDQQPKNGCTSPQPYSGSLTTPAFTPGGGPEIRRVHSLPGLVRDRERGPQRVRPHDGRIQRATAGATWNPLDNSDLTAGDLARHPQAERPTPVTRTTARAPRRASRTSTSTCRCRWRIAGCPGACQFDTGDTTYQGFRGVGIDHLSIEPRPAVPAANFDSGVAGGLDLRWSQRSRRAVLAGASKPAEHRASRAPRSIRIS